jgi:FkbM family methyltransferase
MEERIEMTADQNIQLKLETKLRDVTEENDLLLRQLHHVQEELERYFLQNRDLERRQVTGVQNVALGVGWVDEELPDALTENRRLQALVETQKRVHQLGTQNALNIKLGDILIRGTDSPVSLFSVPGKLAKIWWQSGRQTPPKSLGGKGFDNVIEAYGKGGLSAAEKLLDGASISSVMQANAYTVLARKLMSSDRNNAAIAARRAYEVDPKSYRLKWLAFRLHEAGEVIEAEAILDTLPPDTPFSESETRQVNQVRYEARNVRQSEAEQKSGFVERRAQIERRLTNLSRERDRQATLAAEHGREVEVLRQARAQWERERQALSGRHDEQAKLAAERGREVEALKQAQVQLEQEGLALSERHDEQAMLAAERGREMEALKQAKAQWEQERLALSERHDEQAKLAAERGREVEALRQARVQWEQEMLVLSGRHDEQAKLAAERGREVEALRQSTAQLERERLALSGRHDEQATLATERGREVEVLRHAKAQWEQEKLAISGRHDEQAALAAERGRDVEVLRQARAQLEQEKRALQHESEELGKQLQGMQKLVPAKFLHVLKGKLDAMPKASNLPDVSLVFVEHGAKVFFFAHFSNDHIPKQMAKWNQFYEASYLDLLARLHQPGKLIVDGGANIGNHSVFFAGVMGASVIAFEPQSFNHEFLVANVRLNHLEEKIHIRKIAIGDQTGTISLTQALPDNYGSYTANTALVRSGDKNARAADSFDVQVSTLDLELKGHEGEISIIKLDLEGMELDVLTGARAVIENSLPVIAVECFTKSFYEEIKNFLAPFGYFVIDSTNATPTFIFLTRKNPHHMEILSEYLELSSVGKFSKDNSFNEIVCQASGS